ncbi:MAG: ribonuclease T2 [Rhodobacterales bacterium]|nr:ribonuclease T2 [Rhodobacterales bacterium]
MQPRTVRAALALVLAAVLAAGLAAGPAAAEGERAGDFDYYVMALSWSSGWCLREGDARGADQCHPRHDYSFTLHGLWPQDEVGWPSWCRTGAADPGRAQTAAMADIMGSPGLAWHQWQKHGRCSGLTAQGYFDLSRRAYQSVTIPPVLTRVDRDLTLPARVIEEAFLEANPDMQATGVTVTCEAGMIEEVRICLTRDLDPRPCGPDVARDCRMPDALLPAVR